MDRHLPELPKASPPVTPGPAAAPLKALLLRVGTIDRIALSEVLAVTATQKADAAQEALRDFAADVVIADIGASDFEAKVLLRHIRNPATTPRKGLPVIYLLAESSPKRVHSLVKSGVDHVMIKPISATALRDLAQYLCDNPVPQVSVPHYVGPDRRRLPDGSYTGPDRRGDELD